MGSAVLIVSRSLTNRFATYLPRAKVMFFFFIFSLRCAGGQREAQGNVGDVQGKRT